MAGRRWLFAIVALAMTLHTAGIARSSLPAQDGLKFIRIARQFQTGPWADTIRSSDQHPLFPALIAIAEPVIALMRGGNHGPETWRIAAQMVAASASMLLLIPLYRITKSLFDQRIATLAVAIYALLPLPAGWGREALADSVGLCFLMYSLQFGSQAVRFGSWRAGVFAGLAGGIGYLARPEVILAPAAVAVAFFLSMRLQHLSFELKPAFAVIAVSALVPVGAYALVKGEVSEKLAIRYATTRVDRAVPTRKTPQLLPRGLDDQRWDFSPKEESEGTKIDGWKSASRRIFTQWGRETAWIFGAMFVWGLVRQRFIRELCFGRVPEDPSRPERNVLIAFLILYTLALARHAALLGYLSDRHTLALVLGSTPWAAAGTYVCLRGLAVKFGWTPRFARTMRLAFGCFVISSIIYFQLRTTHASRRGHLEAGHWLAAHCKATEASLDTRGWASFVADRAPGESYDYWHVRQALTDRRLGYIVVEADELKAGSPRAKTLQALLAYAAEPVQEFPTSSGDDAARVRIYRFQHPADWKGMLP